MVKIHEIPEFRNRRTRGLVYDVCGTGIARRGGVFEIYDEPLRPMRGVLNMCDERYPQTRGRF